MMFQKPNWNGAKVIPTILPPFYCIAFQYSFLSGRRDGVTASLLGIAHNHSFSYWHPGTHPWECVMHINLVCYLMAEAEKMLN